MVQRDRRDMDQLVEALDHLKIEHNSNNNNGAAGLDLHSNIEW